MQPAMKLVEPIDLEEKVFEIISRRLRVPRERVQNQSAFADFHADSLEVLELLAEFESEFQVSISQEEAERLRTPADVVRLLRTRSTTLTNGAHP